MTIGALDHRTGTESPANINKDSVMSNLKNAGATLLAWFIAVQPMMNTIAFAQPVPAKKIGVTSEQRVARSAVLHSIIERNETTSKICTISSDRQTHRTASRSESCAASI